MLKHLTSALLVSLLLSACTSASTTSNTVAPSATLAPTTTASPPGTEPPATSGPPVTTATTAAPATTEGAPAYFEWTDEPVVTREMIGTDHNYMNPGAVIDHDGTLHMYANVFTAWPGPVEVYHFMSADGAAWELASPDPVMKSADVPFTTAGHDVSTGFVTDDGTWILVFSTVTSEPWEIGVATAPGPEGPWTVHPEAVLQGLGAEAGEEGGVAWPSVVPTDDGWAMYFTSVTRPRRGGTINMATSTDGLTWERRQEPVLMAEADWELTSLDRARVVPVDGGYVMLYSGRTITDRGLATSPDGITWSRVGDEPVLKQADHPVAHSDSWDSALVERAGTMLFFLEVGFLSNASGTNIFLATAPTP